MFSQFFEKKKTAGVSSGLNAKKSKRSSSPNDSSSSLIKYFQAKQQSPTGKKIAVTQRPSSPVTTTQALDKISYDKILNVNHLRIRQSQSPRGGRSGILNFFKSRDKASSENKKKEPDTHKETGEYFVGAMTKKNQPRMTNFSQSNFLAKMLKKDSSKNLVKASGHNNLQPEHTS